MKLAKLEEEKKDIYFLLFLSLLFVILFYSSSKMAHIHTDRKKKEYFHCKKVRHTHTVQAG
jgi:hypothetical protein